MRFAITLIICACVTQPVFAEECVTSADDYWVCQGDIAWGTGWLLEPDVLTMEQVQVWHEQADLLPEMQGQRDTFQQQRDQAMIDIDMWSDDYKEMRAHAELLERSLVNSQAEIDSKYSGLEVLGVGLGAGAGGILIGFLIGALAI